MDVEQTVDQGGGQQSEGDRNSDPIEADMCPIGFQDKGQTDARQGVAKQQKKNKGLPWIAKMLVKPCQHKPYRCENHGQDKIETFVIDHLGKLKLVGGSDRVRIYFGLTEITVHGCLAVLDVDLRV